MTTLAQLLEQQRAIQEQIAKLRSEERASALAQVLAIIEEQGFTAADLFGKGLQAKPKQTRQPAAAKYERDGKTWTGQGRRPKWLPPGEEGEKYRIKA